MALKFLNKKGSLRNIEKVWIAEQKQEVEQRKLEELRIQIQQEKDRSEFRDLEEQAGLVLRRPERLEFLYDSDFIVSNQNQNANHRNRGTNVDDSVNNKKRPGALFDDKTYSANDSWRKSISDPLFLIRQREEEARKLKERRKEGEVSNEHKRKHLRRV